MTTNGQVSQWLQFALQQVAAESYLHRMPDVNNPARLIERLMFGFNDPLHPYVKSLSGAPSTDPESDLLGDPRTPFLDGANRMPEVVARDFVERYEIKEQFSNNEFGFSATVLRERSTGQYTLSFKSLEYPNWNEGGDWERDGRPGAAGEIAAAGFAVGQAAAMEEYFQRVSTSGVLAGVDRFNVTGYSLGGHLATLFTLLHPERVIGTTTFNAAGHGPIGGCCAARGSSERLPFGDATLKRGNASVFAGVDRLKSVPLRGQLGGGVPFLVEALDGGRFTG